MRGLALRAAAWTIAGTLVVLAARWLVYALAPPTLLSLELQQESGGPRLLVVAIVALTIGVGVSAAAVWVASLALRERLALDPAIEVGRPSPTPMLAVRFGGLWAATCFAFAILESYLHWRAGLGWHGLHCLVGPVHRDAIPILAALSLPAVALHRCLEHLVAWMRRTIRRLTASPVTSGRDRPQRRPVSTRIPPGRGTWEPRPRGPPTPSVRPRSLVNGRRNRWFESAQAAGASPFRSSPRRCSWSGSAPPGRMPG